MPIFRKLQQWTMMAFKQEKIIVSVLFSTVIKRSFLAPEFIDLHKYKYIIDHCLLFIFFLPHLQWIVGNMHLLASPYLFVSVHILENHWKFFDEIWYLLKFSDTFLVWVKSDKNDTLCAILHKSSVTSKHVLKWKTFRTNAVQMNEWMTCFMPGSLALFQDT
jgi:hypothetical protein